MIFAKFNLSATQATCQRLKGKPASVMKQVIKTLTGQYLSCEIIFALKANGVTKGDYHRDTVRLGQDPIGQRFDNKWISKRIFKPI